MYIGDKMSDIKFDSEKGTKRINVVRNEYGSVYLEIQTDKGLVELSFDNIDDVYLVARTIVNKIDELEIQRGRK